MNEKVKEILDKVLQLPSEVTDGDGFTTNFELLEIQNKIRDLYEEKHGVEQPSSSPGSYPGSRWCESNHRDLRII